MRQINTPKTQLEISTGRGKPFIDRVLQTRRDTDKVKDYTTGIYDIDYAIQYYIKNVIKPTIVENGKFISVPVMYGSPEQWTSMRKMSYLRDKKGKMIVPLIVYSQTGGTKNTEIPVDKLDANNPHLFYTYGQKWSKKNQYSNFSLLTGEAPAYDIFRIIVPDYMNFTYELIIWTSYIEQMNKIIESFVYSEGAYWGEPEKYKFRTTISDYSKTVEISQGNDRYCQVSMTLTVYGYIIPDTINKQLSMKTAPQKVFSNSKILFGMEVDTAFEGVTSIGAKYVPDVLTTFNNAPASTAVLPNLSYEFVRSNYQLIASDVNTSGSLSTITFPGAYLAPVPVDMAALTIDDFTLYINGQNIDRKFYSMPTDGDGNVYVVLDNSNLQFTIAADDTIVIYGKFNGPQSETVIQDDPRLRSKQMIISNISLKDVTLEGQTLITGSLTIEGDTTSSGSITLSSGSFVGPIDLGYY